MALVPGVGVQAPRLSLRSWYRYLLGTYSLWPQVPLLSNGTIAFIWPVSELKPGNEGQARTQAVAWSTHTAVAVAIPIWCGMATCSAWV